MHFTWPPLVWINEILPCKQIGIIDPNGWFTRLHPPVFTHLASASFHAIRIPFPPPPADAFIMTG